MTATALGSCRALQKHILSIFLERTQGKKRTPPKAHSWQNSPMERGCGGQLMHNSTAGRPKKRRKQGARTTQLWNNFLQPSLVAICFKAMK